MFEKFRVRLAKIILPSNYQIKVGPYVNLPSVADIKQLWKETILLGRQKKNVNGAAVLAFRVNGDELAAAEGEADGVLAELREVAAAERARIQKRREERNANAQD